MNSPTERQTRNTRKGKDFMVASGFSGTEFMSARVYGMGLQARGDRNLFRVGK